MKHLIIFALFVCPAFFSANAQSGAGTTALLNSYFDIKNALVNSDARVAVERAGLFFQAAAGMEVSDLPVDKANSFKSIRAKLVADAKKISDTNDLTGQRVYFAALSLDMYALAKMISLSAQPIYKTYCPMKRAYWLSEVPAINNPYYGRVMLTCGKVTETIQPIN